MGEEFFFTYFTFIVFTVRTHSSFGKKNELSGAVFSLMVKCPHLTLEGLGLIRGSTYDSSFLLMCALGGQQVVA